MGSNWTGQAWFTLIYYQWFIQTLCSQSPCPTCTWKRLLCIIPFYQEDLESSKWGKLWDAGLSCVLQLQDFTLFTMAEKRFLYEVESLPRRGKPQDSLRFDLLFFRDCCILQLSTYMKKRYKLRHILALIIYFCQSWFKILNSLCIDTRAVIPLTCLSIIIPKFLTLILRFNCICLPHWYLGNALRLQRHSQSKQNWRWCKHLF